MIQICIDIKQHLLISNMRSLVLDEIKQFGFPLRWAITDVIRNSYDNSSQLKVEAIIII